MNEEQGPELQLIHDAETLHCMRVLDHVIAVLPLKALYEMLNRTFASCYCRLPLN